MFLAPKIAHGHLWEPMGTQYELASHHQCMNRKSFLSIKIYKLGCGTVRVELKLRSTGYRLRFTVSGYGLKNTFASEVFKFLHQKSLWCHQSTHVSCPKRAFEGTPSAKYSVKIKYFERIRLLKTFLFENEQLNSLQNFHRNTAVKSI